MHNDDLYRLTIYLVNDSPQILSGVTKAFVDEGILCVAFENGYSEFYNMEHVRRWGSRPYGTGSD